MLIILLFRFGEPLKIISYTDNSIIDNMYPDIAQSLIDIRELIMQEMENRYPDEIVNSE